MGALGWSAFFRHHFERYSADGHCPGRVAAEYANLFLVYSEQGECLAGVSGRLRRSTQSREDYPAVGDWVALRVDEGGTTTISAVMPRRSKLSRKSAGTVEGEQVLAANVDTVFLMTALNRDFNLRRIERYLALTWDSGANPVILLSKTDLCDDVPSRVADVEEIAPGVPIHAICSLNGDGLSAVREYLKFGTTIAVLGSSGAGKSTLINALIGREVQDTSHIRGSDGRGRHTTTVRRLLPLPGGGNVIDSPGLRELGLWVSGDGLDRAFADIEEYGRQCRFADCRHEVEPGCAVLRAVEDGLIDRQRYENYVKLQRELEYVAAKSDRSQQLEIKRRQKQLSRIIRDFEKR